MDYTGLYYGKKYQLVEPPIASGGEGKILAVRGEPDKLAKVYHNPEKAEQDKLRYMVLETQGVYGNFISRMIAWPLDVLVGDSDRIHGFTMPRFPGVRKLSEILPDQEIDWGKRVVIAWNLCDIVQDVEKMNQCIGDMNPSNFGVNLKTGHVYAFDADSFHFRASNGRLYPCYVGIAEYYAPELQRQITRGQDMRTLNPEKTFSRNTDRFALAVLIFQLLFNGYHPFSARRLEHYGSSTVVHRQATNILNKVCAYFNPQKGTGIPRDAPPIDIVPPKMQQMFKRAFLTEDRPSATEWQGALTELSKSLKTCSNQHSYYTGLPECPWCKGTKIELSRKSTKSGGTAIGTGRTTTDSGGKGIESVTIKTSEGTPTGEYHYIDHTPLKKVREIDPAKKRNHFYDGSTPEKAPTIYVSIKEAHKERIALTVKGEIVVPGGLDIYEMIHFRNGSGEDFYVQQIIEIEFSEIYVFVPTLIMFIIYFFHEFNPVNIGDVISYILIGPLLSSLATTLIISRIIAIPLAPIRIYFYRKKVGI